MPKINPKVKSFRKVCQITAKLKKQGKKIVFVLGIFDILHRGHVALLVEAKKRGDILVAGVDHDDNTRILKGPGRPINDYDSRMFVLANLEPVDYVFLIPSFKAKGLITAEEISDFYKRFYLELKPDIVATCVKAGKHGAFKKKLAEKAGAKFVDIDHGFYGTTTSKIIELLEGRKK